jgi:hypothetical protein
VVNKEDLRISKELFYSFEEIGENPEAWWYNSFEPLQTIPISDS